MEFEITVTLVNDLEKRIADVFSMFDHVGNSVVDHRDIGTILRLLGCCPTQKNIDDIVNATQFTEYKGNIHLAKFLSYVCPMLIEGKMKPASSKKLLECFEFLDPDRLGYLNKDYFIKLMKNEGEHLTDKELREMLVDALDPVTGEISYENYIKKLTYCPKNSIFDLAAKEEEEKISAQNSAKIQTLQFAKF